MSELVLDHANHVVFVTPVVCDEDARKYLPGILGSRGVDPAPAMALLAEFEPIIRAVDESTYPVARMEALARIEMRDARAWPVLATALVLCSPIWTEDKDFFGTGVPTWTSDRVALCLNAADRE